MTKQYIIGLTGFAGAGKDTVADLLVTHCDFRKLAFADALRGEAANAFGVDMVYFTRPSSKAEPMGALSMAHAPMSFLSAVTHALNMHGDGLTKEEYATWLEEPRTPRQIMQWWGTEYRRAQNPNYWTRMLMQHVFDLRHDGYSRFVVTDCRFVNEVQVLRTIGGELWQINRPGVDRSTTPEGLHVSTTDGSEFQPEAVVNNSHTIAHLQQLVLSEFLSRDTGIAGMTVTVPA